MTNPQAPVLDHLLGHSYEVIRYVHDHMAAIEAVASHLTPVEDLVSFRSEVEQLHAQLGLLVEASSIIVNVSDAGYDLMTAADAAAQRVLLQLRSAALHDAAEFANATHFTALQATVAALAALVNNYITTNPGGYLTGAQVEALLVPIRARLDALETVVGDGSIGDIEDRLDDIEGNQTTIWEHINAVVVRVTDTETGLTGLASITQSLTARVVITEAGITSLAASTIELTAQVGTLEDGVLAQGNAIQSLETRATNVEGELSSASTAITVLTAQVTDLANNVDLQGTAIGTLSTRVSATEAGLVVVSEETTQLGGRLTDAETGLTAAGTALDALTVRVEETEEGLTISAERDTALTASITSTGNMAPNSGFEVDLRGWTLFSRGAGWLDAQLSRNLDPMDIPNGVNTLSLTQDEVPLGNAGIRSTKIPIEDGKDYFLSGYIAAENCRVRLEWRTFAPDGSPLEMGIVGQTTAGLPASLGAWPRPFVKLPASGDARLLEIQVWVMECHTDFPKMWLARPMLEQSVGVQNAPSPWTDSLAGLETAMATAYQTLNVRVTETEEGLTALAEALTELEASIGGGFATYQVVTYGGDDFAAVGAPKEAGIYKPGEPASDEFERGLTLVRFAADNTIASSVTYDTFASGTERDNLVTALNALTPSQGFALIGAHAHGIKYAPLTAAIKANGGLGFNEVPGSYPYLLLSRGDIGEGLGIELATTFGGNFIDHTFELSSGIPKGLGTGGALVVVANALTALTVRVTDAEGVIDSHSSQLTVLTARLDDPATGLAAQAAAAALLEARVTSAEGINTAQAASLVSLDSRLDTAELGLSGAASAISSLTTRVTTAEGNITSLAAAITSLDVRLDDAESDLTGQASALSALTTRVTAAEGNITAIADDVTDLTVSIGNIGGGNLVRNGGFEEDTDSNGLADFWSTGGTGTGLAATRPASSLPHSSFMQRIVSTMTNAQYQNITPSAVAYFPAAVENREHVLSAYVMGTTGSGCRLYIQWVNNAGTVISTVTGTLINLAASWQRLVLSGLAPAGTVKALIIVRSYGVAAGAAAATLNVDNVQFQAGTMPTEYAPNITEGFEATASALNSLTVRVTAAEGDITSQATAITDLRAGTNAATNNPNLLTNPSFDVDTTNWSSGGTGGTWLGRFIDSSGPYSGMSASGVSLYRTAWHDVAASGLAGFLIGYSVDLYKTSTVGVVSADVLFLGGGGAVISTAPRAGPISVNGQWVRYGNSMVAPVGTVTVRFRFIVEGTNANDFWRRAKVERGGVSPYNTEGFTGGQARAMSTLSATVSSQGGLITSQAGLITTLTSTVAGKADVTAVTSLTTRVTEMQGSGVNLLVNTTFQNNLNGWIGQGNILGDPGLVRDAHGFTYQPEGVHAMVLLPADGVTVASDYYYGRQDVQVEGGKEYIASGYFGAHRGEGFVYVIYFNTAGANVGTFITPNTALPSPGQTMASYSRLYIKTTAPATAVRVAVCYGFRKSIAGAGGVNPYVWIIRPMFEEVGSQQTTPSRWNSGGVETLAQWSVTLDVNGLITGVQLGNDGSTTSMRIRADMFSIEGSSSGARTEFSSGNWRVYDAAGTMRVRMGIW